MRWFLLHPLPQDYEECFMMMADDSAFQNIAARMFTGHYAYDGSVKLCLDKQQQTSHVNGGRECSADLEDVIQGACNLNFITMWYAKSDVSSLVIQDIMLLAYM